MQERISAIRAAQRSMLEEVHVRAFDSVRVAALEHHGDPNRLLETVRRFIARRRQSGISPKCATFNIAYDDPDSVEPDDFRFDICVAVDRPVAGMVEKVIPAVRCATFRHVGSDEALWRKVGNLYVSWLPSSGEEAGEFPLFLQRVAFFPDVPEHAAVTDVFLPLKNAAI